MKIRIIHAQKPNTEIAEDLPCNAALMVGVVCTSNLQTQISQISILQECYSKTVKTVYEARALLHIHMHCSVFYLAEN
jgi:hypothetical protein